jgi:hypothetical protein
MNPEEMCKSILQLVYERQRKHGRGMTTDLIKEQFGEDTDMADIQYCLRALGKIGDLQLACGDDSVLVVHLTTAGEAKARGHHISPQPVVQNNNTFYMPGGVVNQGIIRDLQINIGSLHDKGMESLSKSLENMVAATTATNQLAPDAKSATLDNLAILTEELVKPNDKRKLAAVRIILLTTIPMLISHAADLVGLWESDLVQQLLTAFGLS